MLVEEGEDRVEIDVPGEAGRFVVMLIRFLSRFAVLLPVVGRFEPGDEQAVQLVEREGLTGADFGFQLRLRGPEESLDQTAGRRVTDRPMEELDVQLGARESECLGVIDFSVVDVEFATGAVVSPGTEKRIDQDIEVLADVVPGPDDVAAVAVDPSGKMCLDNVPLMDDQRAVFKVTLPEGIGPIAGPAAADRLLRDAQLPSCGSFPPQMPIERTARDPAAELLLQDAIDDLVRSVGLLFLQFDGSRQQLCMCFAWLPSIGTWPAKQTGHLFVAEPFPLPSEGSHRDVATSSVGQQSLLGAELPEIGLPFSLGNLSQDEGAQAASTRRRPSLRRYDPWLLTPHVG